MAQEVERIVGTVRVLTIGTFDTIHAGHIGLFRQCRRIAGPVGQVIVGINSDEFVEKYKGAAPLVPYVSRAAVITAIRGVDQIVKNKTHLGQAELIEQARPDVLVVGQDWALKNYLTQLGIGQRWLDERNIQLCYVPRTGDWSSTEIKRGR